MIEQHPFEPFVPLNSQILILGSFPGKESTQRLKENDWFYCAPRNQFWKILESIYNIDLKNRADKENLFHKLTISITDIILSCERMENSNSDINLVYKTYNTNIVNILSQSPIKKILFTSKGVYQEFLENFDKPKGVELIVLPSPSPIFRRLSLDDKINEYKKHFPKI